LAAVLGHVERRLDGELALGIWREIDAVLAGSVAGNEVRVGEVRVLVQPVIPVPYRLHGEVARARSVLAVLRGGLALLVVRDAGDYRRVVAEAIRSLGKPERLDAKRLVGQLARLAAIGGQEPDLHALLGFLVGLHLVRLAIGEEAERAVVAEAGRSILRFAARELDRGRAVGRHLPQVAHVFRAVPVEALHRDGKPFAVGRGRNVGDALQRDVALHRVRHRSSSFLEAEALPDLGGEGGLIERVEV
jgi:hypothetical protein